MEKSAWRLGEGKAGSATWRGCGATGGFVVSSGTPKPGKLSDYVPFTFGCDVALGSLPAAIRSGCIFSLRKSGCSVYKKDGPVRQASAKRTLRKIWRAVYGDPLAASFLPKSRLSESNQLLRCRITIGWGDTRLGVPENDNLR